MTQAQAATPFLKDIHKLAERAGWISAGWRGAYHDSLVKLAAVACEIRGPYRLSGPFESDSKLRVAYSGTDKVVRGILDRLKRTAECTCEICGRRGKRRDTGSSPMVLCARCAAPRLLREAIEVLMRDLAQAEINGSSCVIAYEDLPIQMRLVMQSSIWPRDALTGDDPAKPIVRVEDVRRATSMLKEVRLILDRAIDAQHSN